MKYGLVHLYYGNGKGKTTSAMGLALRALSHGKKVVIVQFLKDGSSGEIKVLKELGAICYAGKLKKGFTKNMSETEIAELKQHQTEILQQALNNEKDILILDEACGVCAKKMVDIELVKAIVASEKNFELVLTGREPATWMLEAADYISEIKCEKHPFKSGIVAREGIEF